MIEDAPAKNGNVTAQIFWLKTWAKWRETPVELRHSGSIGRKDLSELSDDELFGIICSVGIDLTAGRAIDVKPGPRLVQAGRATVCNHAQGMFLGGGMAQPIGDSASPSGPLPS